MAVRNRFNPDQDICLDDINTKKRYAELEFKYKHRRPLPEEAAKRASAYISALAKQYPFQLRYVLALPYWKRFCEAWCESGDEQKALRAI